MISTDCLRYAFCRLARQPTGGYNFAEDFL